jgi:hypothetical protein
MIDVEKLNALVDNELEPAERAEVEALLSQDPQAAAHVGAIRQMKGALQDHVKPVRCEDEWRSCVKRLNEIDGARRTKSIVDRWAWAMCSVLFIFIFGVGLFNRANPGAHAGTGDLTRAGLEKPIRDVYRWLKSELGTTPELPSQGMQLVGAREGTFANRPVANLHLRDSKGDLSFVIVPNLRIEGLSPIDEKFSSCETGEASSVVWSETVGRQRFSMFLTGKRDVQELRAIAQSIQLTPRSAIP